MHFASQAGAVGGLQVARPLARSRRSPARFEPLHRSHPLRASCEDFIAARFDRAYGARVASFSPYLLGVRDALGRWRAAAGYTPAAGRRLFLEQYLDLPIEQALAQRGHAVERTSIVEVGNLAATSIGMARTLIPLLASHLHRLRYEWVVFTATRELRNTFARLGLRPLAVATAEPSRLADGGATWGSYYAMDPVLMAGRISHGVRAPLPA
jgi:hypothetical protein